MADLEPLSPDWWVYRLADRLDAERPQLELLDDYYWGRHPLAHVPPKLKEQYLEEFQELLRQSRANFMGLVVDTLNNRLKVNGFRLSSSEEKEDDDQTWLLWQASRMDSESRLAIRSALTKGRSNLLVWGDGDSAQVTFEDAGQSLVEMMPGSRRQRAAAIKTWIDEWTGKERANVYLPDGIWKYERRIPDNIGVEDRRVLAALGRREEWVQLEDEYAANPFGVVPMVPVVAHPDDLGVGHSEIEAVIPIQDRINATIFNRVLAGWFSAFRQKWATGVHIPEDDNGNPVEPWDQAITRMFVDTDPDAKFGDFSQTDLTPYLKAEEKDIKDIATITATPRHFLIQQGQEPSGDALNAAEAPLLAKGGERQTHLGECLQEAVQLTRLFAGMDPGPVDSEIVWADLRDPSVVEAKRTDSIIKQRQEGLISMAMAQEQLGYTPPQRMRMADELRKEALMMAVAEITAGLGRGRNDDAADAEPGDRTR